MTKTLFATACAAALLICGAAYAQQTSTSDAGAASNAQQGQVQTQQQGSIINGGSSANNGGVQVGPDTSTSDAHSNADSASVSISKGGASTATGGQSSSTSQGGAASAQNQASNAGNAQDITFNSPATPTHTTTDVRSAPTVYAPPLTTTLTDTCMGSSSMSGSGMGWGLSIGSTWEDRNCNRRLYAREVASLTGDREAARAILCQDADVRKAFEDVGRPCPTPGAAQGPMSYVPPPPGPPPAQYLYAAPPPPPPPPPEAAPESNMAPLQGPPEEEPKTPRN
jgi:hypothetical protein